MSSKNSKPRKPRHPLPKVPKYEEPNTIPLAGLGGAVDNEESRYGHHADHHHYKEPGRFGAAILRMLGMKPKGTGKNL